MLGYDQRNHTDRELTTFVNKLAEIDRNVAETRDQARNIAEKATQDVQHYNKQYYDKRYRKPTLYKKGNYVLIRDLRSDPGVNRKLKPKYKGPYMIDKELGNNRYMIKDIPGFNLTPRPYNSILSSDKLKPWVKPFGEG